jgi:putative transposase
VGAAALSASGTSKAPVLRLICEAQLLAPSRTLSKPTNPHTGTIITVRPNEVWASDHTLTATVDKGQVTVFVAVDHCTTECVGLHAAKKATRFEALEPLRQAVRDYCGGFRPGVAAGIRNRQDHGSQYMSNDYQAEIAFLGMESSPSLVRQTGCNDCVERFIRTLKEQLLWGRVFQNVEELRCALAEFRLRYNQRWIVQRLGYLTSAQARPETACTRSCCMNTLNPVSNKSTAKQQAFGSPIRMTASHMIHTG